MGWSSYILLYIIRKYLSKGNAELNSLNLELINMDKNYSDNINYFDIEAIAEVSCPKNFTQIT